MARLYIHAVDDPWLADDADLASRQGMPPDAPADTSRRATATFRAHDQAVRRPFFVVAVFGFLAVVVFALWRAGYPTWRITAAIAPGVLIYAVPFAMYRRQLGRGGTGLSPAQYDLFEHLSLGGAILNAAVTGGLHSPFMFGALFHPSRTIARRGWCRPAQVDLGLLLVAVLLVAALPQRWVGPLVPEPTYSLLAALTIAFTLVFHADYFTSILRRVEASRREVSRARESVAAQALARARELEQFGAQLSHELKNPIGAIKTLVQLSARSAPDAKSRERLRVIEAEVERMHGILQDYLSFSRPVEKLQLERVDLAALVDEVVSVMAGRAEAARISLWREGGAEANADARRVKEALINLVANALEATGAGGSVEIAIEAAAGFARLRVRDSGKGMPADVLARVGTPFFTTREQGTGLGVVLARATFVHHGGALRYDSVEGHGTTATATLPLAAMQGESDVSAAAGG